jgi:hypothetical protein
MRLPSPMAFTLLTMTLSLDPPRPETDVTAIYPSWSLTVPTGASSGPNLATTVAPANVSVLPCHDRSLNIVYCDAAHSVIAACTAGNEVATILRLMEGSMGMCQEPWPVNLTGVATGNMALNRSMETYSWGDIGRTGMYTDHPTTNTTTTALAVRTKFITSVVRRGNRR